MATMNVWNPWDEMLALSDAMDRVMRRSSALRSGGQTLGIALNLHEDTEGYTVKAEMPGLNSDDISIDFADNVLTIKGERKHEQKMEGVTYHLVEHMYGTFQRSVRFPQSVNAEGISADYEHGVLMVRLPKAEEVKPRRIAVNVQGRTLEANTNN
ncbi:MAG: Hsp20/alpha crystallin family protein [Chloroflexaceae bacterium]|nr:Hsp20/alpha crystallin family protein [Chloroflexaceae bacterium]NJL33341.1 Hsp20/alpha crystallin family protein [Chloroflexaceae bacterium]NJO06016.1 Hsp20/alpha crystallin family protein [Chloroflexaceae bacterium]